MICFGFLGSTSSKASEMLSKLESAVEKISEGNNRIAQILTKHDERIEQSMKTDIKVMTVNSSL